MTRRRSEVPCLHLVETFEDGGDLLRQREAMGLEASHRSVETLRTLLE